MTTNSNSSTALNAVATGKAALVDVELYGVSVTPTRLRDTLALQGFDASAVADIDQNSAVRSAGQRWTQGRGNDDRYMCEIGYEDDDTLVLNVLRRETQGEKSKKWMTVTSVTWDKLNGGWFALPVGEHVNKASALVEYCDQNRMYHNADYVRSTVLNPAFKRWASFPLIRRRGGAQVISMAHYDEACRLADAIASIGTSHMGVVTLDLADARTIASVTTSAKQHLGEKIKSLRSQVADWRSGAKRASKGAIMDRLTEFKALRNEADLYARSLSLTLDDLLGDITSAETDAKALLRKAMGLEPVVTDEQKADDAAETAAVTAEDVAEAMKATMLASLAAAEAAEPTVEEITAKTYSREDLEDLRPSQLSDIAAGLDVEKYQFMNKSTKVASILAAQG